MTPRGVASRVFGPTFVHMFRTTLRRCLLAIAVSTTTAPAALAQTVLYVDTAAPAGGNGLTWGTAFRNIRGAMNLAATTPSVTEIWVADGTYSPGATPFDIRNNLTLYGGFAGGETSLDQRDPDANIATISGGGTAKLLNTAQTDGTAVVDGFTLRDGRTSGSGAVCSDGQPVFRRCRFIANTAGGSGGVWESYSGSATFIDCRFISNSASRGSVAYTYEGSLTFIQCRVFNNAAGTGSVIATYDGPITLVNSAVCGNTGPDGGGVSTYEGALTVVGCTIANNTGFGVTNSGYGLVPAFVRNSVIVGNGGPVDVDAAYSMFDLLVPGEGNVTGDANFANPAARDYRLGAGAPAIDAGSNLEIPADTYDIDRDGDTTEPWPVDLGGLARRDDAKSVPDTGLGKAPVVDMGAFEYFPDCNGNGVEDAFDIAGGVSTDLDFNGIPDDCEDCNGNSLPDSIDIAQGLSQDCQADGIPDECQTDLPVITYRADDGSIENTIGLVNASDVAWFNRFEVEEGGEILRDVRIAWGDGLPPQFVATVYVWADANRDGYPYDAYVLASEIVFVESPGTGTLQVVDIADTYIGPAGTPFFVGALVSADAGAGVAPIDLGAPSSGRGWIASSPTGTLNPNDLASADLFGQIDIYGFPGEWIVRAKGFRDADCNGNGQRDDCDIYAETSLDCQLDGIPDECQLTANDCNQNGIPDDCELASGALTDCQPNGVPDQCELAAGTAFDLDGNGVPDDCEDCDGNGLPDSLDILAGAPDCQPDGILDACQLGSDLPESYRRDDGTAEIYVSSDAPNMAWLTQFEIVPGAERITAIEVLHARLPLGKLVDVYLWSDPNGDGDPTDAQVLAHAATLVQSPDTNTYETADIPDTYVGPAGTSFFVGAIVHDFVLFTDYPGAKHSTAPTYTSWLVGKNGVIDPNDLSLDNDEFLRIDDLGGAFVGVWCLRASAEATNDCNLNGVPDDCDIAEGTSADVDGDGFPDECYPPACPADLDGDGQVDAADLAVLLGSWGTGKIDLDGDGATNASDLSILLGAWGGC